MLTRAGWTVVAGAAATLAAGRLLGVTEAYVVVAAGCVLVIGSLLWVHLRPVGLALERTVRPGRVHAGRPARVDVLARSTGRAPSPVVTLRDALDERPGAHLRLAPVHRGATVRAAYRLPTRARGEVVLGPMTLELTDPLGLARRRRPAVGRARLVVLPRVDPLTPLVTTAGTDPLSGREGRTGLGPAGDEFRALRPYVVGDDTRRIHWPMSARVDDLVVRQVEEPRQGRVTVVLDVAPTTEPATFEDMVSAAASLAVAHWRTGDLVRLLTTTGHDTGWVTGRAALDHLLEDLALVTVSSDGADLGRVLTLTERAPHSLVLVSATRTGPELARLAVERSRRVGAGRLTVVRFPDPAGLPSHAPPGVRVVDVGDRPFAEAWDAGAARGARRSTVGAW